MSLAATESFVPATPALTTAPAVQTKVTVSEKIIANVFSWLFLLDGLTDCIGLGIAGCCAVTGEEFHQLLKLYPGPLFAIQANVTRTRVSEKSLVQADGLHGIFRTEEIEALFNVNLLGEFYSARVAAKAFIKRGVKGIGVFTDSMASLFQKVPSAQHGASRVCARNMAHTLATEWAKYGIRVNSISPGLTNAAITYWVPQQQVWEQQLKYYGAMPRLAEVQELEGAYTRLPSVAASHTISIDILSTTLLEFAKSHIWRVMECL
ncbi:3-oxoacyl-reductase 2 [Hyaloscypha sp. PMI_1271]|nr:3-oxoacyl-reductase 2 [Hyaloscypha sp. PMI_1271]